MDMTNHYSDVKQTEEGSPGYLKIILIILFLSVPIIFIMADNLICKSCGSGSHAAYESEYYFTNNCDKPWYDRFF